MTCVEMRPYTNIQFSNWTLGEQGPVPNRKWVVLLGNSVKLAPEQLMDFYWVELSPHGPEQTWYNFPDAGHTKPNSVSGVH